MRRIRTLIAAGLNTELIAQVLHCFRGDAESPEPTCAEMVAELDAARESMAARIEDLRSSQALLDMIIDAAPKEADRAAV